ncbi:DUF3566 domain-containing protein [Actinomadura oligospora]|uniref:DUF3566 domain-containing protein n=1 Tax=Actinomadura oligospora TaxID=111804 RepID=UPI0004AD4B8D|nr:DUF3566 domain-containing protein [Actinomadura oligospora]
MSSEPGKDKPVGDSGSASGRSSERGKAVPATSKPGRDEATVEITPSVDETKHDLPKIEDRSSSASSKSVTSAAAKSASPKPAAKAPGRPVAGGPSKPAWDEPAEPADSVSADRTDKRFTRAESPSAAAAAAPAPGGGGFAGTVLKDRPATPPPARPAPSPVGGPSGPATRPAASAKTARKAQLRLARLEPWSVMKFSFVMSLVCFVVLLVAVVVLWMILSGLGVFDAIANTVQDLTSKQGEDSGGVDAGSWFSFPRVLGYTVLVGALNVMLITALSTVGSVIYNLAADLVGGVEVTLKEAE